MTEDQWKVAWDLYRKVSELPASEQRVCLQSSGVSAEILAEVDSLLRPVDASGAHAAEPAGIRFGTRVGHYVVVARLASGGMGNVYSARDTELDRMVALKFLNPDRIGVASALERFVREAKAASSLNHPNIVTIYEVLRSEPTLAIAMELIDGRALREFCAAPPAVEEIIRWGRQVADALSDAHGRGIVHRDIKPDNIMLRRDGLIKVLDFGLARQLDIGDQSSTAGLAVGTLRYMSPELARGETLTGASDIFSLGIVLYEISTGNHPFHASSPFATVHAIAASAPTAPFAQLKDSPGTGFAHSGDVGKRSEGSPGCRFCCPNAREALACGLQRWQDRFRTEACQPGA